MIEYNLKALNGVFLIFNANCISATVQSFLSASNSLIRPEVSNSEGLTYKSHFFLMLAYFVLNPVYFNG